MRVEGDVPVSGPPLRAPREHGATLAEPPLSEAGALLALNRQRLGRIDRRVLGRPFAEVRRQARQEVADAAREYLTRLGEPLPDVPTPSGVLFVAGHQPELFHPGVWVKSFALCGLARAHGGSAINLVVDNDAVKTASLTVPQVRLPLPPVEEFRPHTRPVPFDDVPLGIPFEEWAVRDEALFASLPDRAREDWGFTPLLADLWAEALARAPHTPMMADRLTAARRAVERRWGCHNLEVPVHGVSRTGAFAWFVADLLADLPRFHAAHNDCLRDYRRAHGLRSRNHPVPELARDGDWLEAPFWGWRAGRGQRGRLLVRPTGTGFDLRAGDEEWPAVGPGPGDLAALEGEGLKVRPRALMNTLFARLFVADLFVHGIGGGKYDALTDAIVRRFYAAEPPAYLVLSGTLLLPFPAYATGPQDVRRLARLARDLHYNPQRYLGPSPAVDPLTAELLARRQESVADRPEDAADKKRRWRTLQSLTEQLRPAVEGRRRLALRQLERARKQLEGNAVLRRRDYAFCLHPAEELRRFCTRFLSEGDR